MWVCAVALLFFQAANTGSDPQLEGLKALDEGRYPAAVESFNKAIQANPNDYSAHFNLALAYSLLQNDASALAEYHKVLELKPGLYEAQLNAGILLLRQKKPNEAAALLEGAVAQKPGEYRPLYYLAEAQLGIGEYSKAEENYRAAIAIDPKQAGAQLGLARSLARQGKIAEAVPYFRQAAQLDPKYSDSLLELAALYEKNGQTSEAIEIYKQFPGDTAIAEHLGALLLESKQYDQAIPQLAAAFAKSPNQANRVTLAMAYLSNHQADQAAPLLDQAVAAEPGNFDIRVMYARVLRDRKQYQPAARQFQEALKIKPDSGHTWDELGGVLYLAEDYQGSLAALERARQLGENIAGNWFLRAIILDKFHQLKPALEAYEQFLSMSQNQNPDQEFQARQRVRIIRRELERR